MKPYRYLMPTEVVFESGALNTLGERCAPFGKKPLLVTGRHFARATGALDRALEQLPAAAVFDEVDENPTTACCERGAEVCASADCDFVVALGGGSPIDAAKAIALLARNPGNCRDFFGTDKFTQGALPIVAVPTTAGSGSELTPYSVLVDAKEHVKRTVRGRSLFPRLALLDPELSITLPRAVTIATGLDALSQGMEGMLSRNTSAAGDVLALEVCRLVRHWLPTAADEPENLEARAQMLHAAMLSGCVIAQTGTTLVHGMGYVFTLEFGIAHGLANALLLTPVFQHNAKHEPAKVAAIATALGHDGPEQDAADNIAAALHGLLADVDVSPAAKDAGAQHERLRWCAEEIHSDASRFKNQIGEFTVDDVHALFEAAYLGETSLNHPKSLL